MSFPPKLCLFREKKTNFNEFSNKILHVASTDGDMHIMKSWWETLALVKEYLFEK
jgi:hypothetical protein